MFFSSELSFKNLAMEKASSPIISNVWRACTVASLVSAVFLLLYLNQGNRVFITDSLKPTDGLSVSKSSVHAFPNESEVNGTSDGPSVADGNGNLEHLSSVNANETLEDSPLLVENKTLEDTLPQAKNESLEGSLPQAKDEKPEDLLPQGKDKTSADSLPQVKSETTDDSLPQVKKETSEDSLPQVNNETLSVPQVRDENSVDSSQVKNETPKMEENGTATEDNRTKGEDNYCDVFDGRWVEDPTNSPAYKAHDCPFLSDQVDCRRNGRPEFNYEKWSWEGNSCKIPRMNRTDLLERLRGKRVIVVGDSLNRNQFESFACLLYSAVPKWDAFVDVSSGVYKIFRSKSYRCSVEFFWAPFLVEMEQKDQSSPKVLKLDQINPSANKWKGADVMIFNTGHWWVHLGKLKAWDMIRYRGKMVESMDLESAFLKGMKTWSRWVDRNVNPSQTTVFFRSISPEHKGRNWCYEPTEPLMDESYIEIFPRPVRAIVEDTIKKMRTPVRFLNITHLAQYRIDAHPKVYTTKGGVLLTEEKRKQPEFYADCSHWCIPGVPDTWNRLVYASLVLDGFGPNSTSLLRRFSSQ